MIFRFLKIVPKLWNAFIFNNYKGIPRDMVYAIQFTKHIVLIRYSSTVFGYYIGKTYITFKERGLSFLFLGNLLISSLALIFLLFRLDSLTDSEFIGFRFWSLSLIYRSFRECLRQEKYKYYYY